MSDVAEKLRMLEQETQFRDKSLEYLAKSYTPNLQFAMKTQQAVLNFATADMLRLNYIFDHLTEMDEDDIRCMQEILKPMVKDHIRDIWRNYIEDLGMPFVSGEITYETVLGAR